MKLLTRVLLPMLLLTGFDTAEEGYQLKIFPTTVADKYYLEFVDILVANNIVINYQQEFFTSKDLPKGLYGACHQESGFIILDPHNWESLKDQDKRAVIYHELVHCFFDDSTHSIIIHDLMYHEYSPGQWQIMYGGGPKGALQEYLDTKKGR